MSHNAVQNGLAALLQVTSREPKGPGRAAPIPIAWTSTKGLVRTENQDRVIVARSNDIVLAVLADGMGGMRDGARAASVAASAAASWCMFASPDSALDLRLLRALKYANEEVFRELHGEGGAAVVVAARQDDSWRVAHAGDTRAYHLRETDVEQLTTDDTMRGQLGQMGYAQPEGAETGLIQFIGMGPDLEPHVRGIPSGGRALLLTSDGIHSLPAPIFDWVVRHAKALQAATERLVQVSEWHGGHDNGTAVAVGLANGFSEGRRAGFVEFWVPGGEHLVVLPPSAPAEAPRTLPREAPTPVAPIPNPEPITQQRRQPPAPPASYEKVVSDTTGKARPGRKRSKSSADKKSSLTEKVPRGRDLPQLPIVTIDAGPEEDASGKDQHESRDSRSGSPVSRREGPDHKTR